MRNLFKLTLTLLAATAWLPGAQAQSFPNRPIRVVVPFPAGGNVDTYIRQLARQMEISMGQPLVVDNRGGANGIVGCDIVAKAAPDGYTILATSIAFAVNPAMDKKLPYDSEKDFLPITNYANGLHRQKYCESLAHLVVPACCSKFGG